MVSLGPTQIIPFNSMKTSIKHQAVALAVAVTMGAGISLQAQSILNGGFELSTNGANKQADRDTQASNWTSTLVPQSNYWAGVGMGSYSFLMGSSSGTAPSYTDSPSTMTLWGPHNGVQNGLTDSPDGGNFWMTDAGWNTGKLEQTVSGLTAGVTYTLSFWSAGAQQQGYDGATSTRWSVTFDGVTQTTSYLNIASRGFSGWQKQTMEFTASGTSALLTFLADGSPSGLPPMALLDGVSLAPVPEPSSYAAVIGGLLAVAAVARRRASR